MDAIHKEFLIKNYLSPSEADWLGNLSIKKSKAVLELLSFELAANEKSVNTDLRYFDFETNKIISKILNRSLSNKKIHVRQLDQTSQEHVQNITNSLEKNGYSVGEYALSDKTLTALKESVLECQYASKDGEVFLSGNKIISEQKKLIKNAGPGSDTFWLIDQNELLNQNSISDLINDPVIMRSVAGYLGCAPVLAQANAWLSLPTMATSTNLNVNAQQFHQDKEFAKFIKVFVYLNDVDIKNGAHSYIVESHKDELHKKGIPISSRVSDADILIYYSKEQIFSAEGNAGTVIFADTSCVHKGGIVSSGYRIMLQLEFTSSLYMSQVEPFNKMTNILISKLENNSFYDASRLLNNVDETKNISYVANGKLQKIKKVSLKKKLKKYVYKALLPFLKKR
jgi:ectoine hydroxylase-related dioxygenase (phytanoyl-CoA dioxygenase family)